MSRRALTSVDDFNYWMVDMDDALDRFFARFPDDLRRQLDYSPASLDIVEQRILDRFPDPKQMLEAEHAQEVDGAARSTCTASRGGCSTSSPSPLPPR
jgi:hypothetical protein